MRRPKSLMGCELWPVPGFQAMAAILTEAGPAPVSLAGPKGVPRALIIGGEELELVRGLAAHAARAGLAVLALAGRPAARGPSLLQAAAELAAQRGAERVAFAGHGAWASAAVDAAPGRAEAVLALDPSDAGAEPSRLHGIPLWIAAGTEHAAAARALHERASHPRSLIELPAVPRLVHAVNDVAAELIPFARHVLGR